MGKIFSYLIRRTEVKNKNQLFFLAFCQIKCLDNKAIKEKTIKIL